MPANVEYMASANGQIPWHEIGFVFEKGEYPNLQAMMKASETDTLVKFYRVASGIEYDPDDPMNDDFDPELTIFDSHIPGWYAVRRWCPQYPERQGTVYNMVKSRYRLFQNYDVAEFLELVLKQAGSMDMEYRWDTMGTLGNGNRFFATLMMPQDLVINGTDRITRAMLATTSHDGSKPFIAKNINERVVCANTLGMALREAGNQIKIRHTTNMVERVEQAVETLQLTSRYQTEFARVAERLAATDYSLAQFEQLATELIPVVDKATTDKEKKEAERDKERQEALISNYVHSPTVAPIQDTAWGAWNAVTEFEQHKQKTRQSKRDDAERKTEFAFFDSDGADTLGSKSLELLTATWDDMAVKPKRKARAKKVLTNK